MIHHCQWPYVYKNSRIHTLTFNILQHTSFINHQFIILLHTTSHTFKDCYPYVCLAGIRREPVHAKKRTQQSCATYACWHTWESRTLKLKISKLKTKNIAILLRCVVQYCYIDDYLAHYCYIVMRMWPFAGWRILADMYGLRIHDVEDTNRLGGDENVMMSTGLGEQ